ncbi:MAG: ATP synthase F1 subunit delta [Candidatus Omnitrophica bacterium]|nr:ATP synthase F1 subunit delta [Candidatus Omnitrophota bacterium]
MKNRIITKRYAEAFVEYAKDTFGVEQCIEQTKKLKNIITDNPDFLNILLNLGITNSEKYEFLDQVLAGSFSPQLLHFLKLIIEKRRSALLVDMLDYIRVNYSHGEAVEVILRSAYLLDLEYVREIKEKLEAKLEKKLHFNFQIEPALLGGVQVMIGNTLIDGTLKRRLDELRDDLKSVRMV